MGDARLDFVDAIDANPTVLLDLNDSTWVLSRITVSLPRRRSSMAQSYLVDGSAEAAGAWTNRELQATLSLAEPSEDAAATEWQKLARMLTAPRWLRYIPRDSDTPVFLRTLPVAPDAIDDFRGTHPGHRSIEVTIPADPFAYGLPESGNTTVVNDPTQTNGMRFEIADVKGDVPAPLRLEVEFSSDRGPRHKVIVAASTDTDAFRSVLPSDGVTPPWDLGDPGFVVEDWPSIGVWSIGPVTDASSVQGWFYRATQPNSVDTGFNVLNAAWINVYVPAMEAGEYRVLLRGRASRSSVIAVPFGGRSDSIQIERTVPLGTVWQWLDLGVVRLPVGAPKRSPWTPQAPSLGALRLYANVIAPGTSINIDIDHVVLLPAPGADGLSGTSGSFSSVVGVDLGWDDLTISGADEQAYRTVVRSEGPALGSVWTDGGFPRVSPGADNVVCLASSLISPSDYSEPGADPKTASADVDWTYHPRYLYLRGD